MITWKIIGRSGYGFFQSKLEKLAMAMGQINGKTLEEVAMAFSSPNWKSWRWLCSNSMEKTLEEVAMAFYSPNWKIWRWLCSKSLID